MSLFDVRIFEWPKQRWRGNKINDNKIWQFSNQVAFNYSKVLQLFFFSSHFCSMLALETAMQVSNLESAQIAQFQKQKKNQKEKRIVRKKNSQNCKEKRNYSIILIFCLKFLSPVYRAPRISLSLSSTDWSWSLSLSLFPLRLESIIWFCLSDSLKYSTESSRIQMFQILDKNHCMSICVLWLLMIDFISLF